MKVKLDMCNHMVREISEVVFKNGSKHLKESCSDCGKYITFVPRDIPTDFKELATVVMPYGKHKGKEIGELLDKHLDYLNWLADLKSFEGRCAKRMLEVLELGYKNMEPIGLIVKGVMNKIPKDRV